MHPRTVLGNAFTLRLVIGKIEHMENNFGLEHIPRKEEEESSGAGFKVALVGAALAAGVAGVALENDSNDSALQAQAEAHTQMIENAAALPARESIPLNAFYAVDEYKEVAGNTWEFRSVPGSDSEQDKMQAAIAQKHGVSLEDFKNAFEYKLRDAGLE